MSAALSAAVSHAILSPSSGDRWLTGGCTGSPALNYGREDNGNIYADEGTAAHYLLEWCLAVGKDAADFPAPVIHVGVDGNAFALGPGEELDEVSPVAIRNSFEADEVMREHVQTVVDDIRRHAKGEEIIAEQRVFFNNTLGVPAEFGSGTIDARVRIAVERGLQMHDLKYGASPKGIVYAGTPEKPNPQLGLYGLGAIEEDELVQEYDYVELHIHQPRLRHKDMVRVPIEQMRAFAQSAKAAAAEALMGFHQNADGSLVRGPKGELYPLSMEALDEMGMLKPSAKGCHYCAVADSCAALRRKNAQTVADFFDEIPEDQLPEPSAPGLTAKDDAEYSFQKPYPSPADLSLLETFVSAVRDGAHAKLKQGVKVPGWKLVRGKRGARAWVKTKLAEIEKLLKDKFRMKQEEMYTKKLITPTQAEAVLKDNPKRWAQINTKDFIEQSEGGETLVAEDDPRKAIEHQAVRDMFEDDASDLI